MKKALLFVTFATILALSGCEKEPQQSAEMDGLTLDNFPIMDGSTSTDPLVRTIACELLGYDYGWEQPEGMATWEISTMLPESFIKKKLKCTQTHNALMSMASGGWFGTPPDIVFSARRLSADEQAEADYSGITLVETPIALDALTFIANSESVTVDGLTHKQIEDIYLAKIHNWNEVGGDDMEIVPFVRNKNSGSQELMESLVMSEPIPDGFYEDHYEDFQVVGSMYPVLTDVGYAAGGLGYTVYYYLTQIVRNGTFDHLKTLSVNGIAPTKETIANRSYPFTAEVYMIIRADLDHSSPAYKVYEYMQTETGKNIIARSGYAPVD